VLDDAFGRAQSQAPTHWHNNDPKANALPRRESRRLTPAPSCGEDVSAGWRRSPDAVIQFVALPLNPSKPDQKVRSSEQ